MVLDEVGKEATLAGAQVENATGTGGPKRGHDRTNSLVGQADPLLDRGLFGVVSDLGLVGLRILVGDELAKRLARQARLASQVSTRDELALGMRRQPAFAPEE